MSRRGNSTVPLPADERAGLETEPRARQAVDDFVVTEDAFVPYFDQFEGRRVERGAVRPATPDEGPMTVIG